MHLFVPTFTPLLNEIILKDPKERFLQEKGHWRGLETVLFPGTCIEKLEEQKIEKHTLFRVKVPSYEEQKNLYILSYYLDLKQAFCSHFSSLILQENRPTYTEIAYNWIQEKLGIPYIWGGNSQEVQNLSIEGSPSFQGYDCSGLVYAFLWEILNGCITKSGVYLPRNSSDFLSWPYASKIEMDILWENPTLMLEKLKKRCFAQKDMLLFMGWKGHIIFVFPEKEEVAESREGYGVVITKFTERMQELRLQEEELFVKGLCFFFINIEALRIE